MKKVWIIVLVWICLLGFVGCDPGVNSIDGADLLENTVKIELFSYENISPKLIKLSKKNKPVFDFSKATLIAALDASLFEDVVKDIAEQECLVFPSVLSQPIGKTLILYQENGDMVVLFSCVYKEEHKLTRYYGECNIFDKNGVFIEHIGRIDSDFVDILESKYFNNNV